MRTAYSVAKGNKPLVAFQELSELKEANALNLGRKFCLIIYVRSTWRLGDDRSGEGLSFFGTSRA